tara:strand:+ start:2053 stop:2211 length:159 start_codon:yes stop_codon:yes gene_type:complete
MKRLKDTKVPLLTKAQTLFLCAATVLSLVCWGFWEMVFSVLGVLFDLVKGVV